MRKILSVLITASVVLTACKKDHHINVVTGNDLQKVTFQVGFSQVTGGFETNSLKVNAVDTSITNNIEVLYYMVFDSNGKSLHTVKQVNTDAGFGSYTDNLHPGTYTVAIAGGKTGLSTTAADLTAQTLSYVPFAGKDLFFNKITLVVTTTASTQTVNLQRVTSKLQTIIKDAIPSNVVSMQMVLQYPNTKFAVGTATGYDVNVPAPRKYTFAIPAATRGTINYTMTTDLFFSQGSVSVFLKAFDSNNVIVSQKTVVATTGQNKITILSGNLFGGSGGSGGGFVIGVPGWNAPVTQTF